MKDKVYQKEFIEQLRKEKGLQKSDDGMIKDFLDMIDEELVSIESQKIGRTLYFEYYNHIITDEEFEKRLSKWNKKAIEKATKKFRKKYGEGIW